MFSCDYLKNAFTFGEKNELIEVKKTKSSKPLTKNVREITDYPFIMHNKARISLIVVDVDNIGDDDSGYIPGFDPATYDNAYAPVPVCAVSTSGQRFQAFYMLVDSLPCKNTSRLSLAYFKDIRNGLIGALGGDFALSYHGAVRNPFYKHALVRYFHDHPSYLGDLETLYKSPSFGLKKLDDEYIKGNRNNAMFLYLLNTHLKSPVKLTRNQLFQVGNEFQVKHINVDPLSETELKGIANSVLRNCGHYTCSDRHHDPSWDVGVMEFEPIDPKLMSGKEIEAEIKRRKQLSQVRTSKIVTERTLRKIQDALSKMLHTGDKITKAALAQCAKVSRTTVYKHWQTLTGEV